MPKQRGEKRKSSLPGEEVLPACVRPRGVEGRSWGLTCCPHFASSSTAPAQEHLPAPPSDRRLSQPPSMSFSSTSSQSVFVSL